MLCSVLLVDDDSSPLRHGAAPSRPAEYSAAVVVVVVAVVVDATCGRGPMREHAER